MADKNLKIGSTPGREEKENGRQKKDREQNHEPAHDLESKSQTKHDKRDDDRSYAQILRKLLHSTLPVTVFCSLCASAPDVWRAGLFAVLYSTIYLLLYTARHYSWGVSLKNSPLITPWTQTRAALALVATSFALSGSPLIAVILPMAFSAYGCALADFLVVFGSDPLPEGGVT